MTRHRIIPTLVVTLLVVSGAAAQDRDTVFVHGLASDAGTWSGASARLAQQLAIRPFQANLNWRALYEAQAVELEQKASGSTNVGPIAIGHSNGGVVARQWGRNRGLSSVITLGSPNQGAPIVDHIYEWFAFLDDILVRITNVNAIFTSRVDQDAWWWLPAQWAAHHALGVQARATAGFGLIALGFDVGLPVLSEMRAGSSYMANLNSADNRAREAAAVPARAAIVNVAADFYDGGPMRIVRPDDYQAWHIAINAAGIGLEGLAGLVRILADGRDLAAFDLADEISGVAEWFLQFEEVWCRVVSDPSPLPIAGCYEHDGIVPAWSQAYDYPRVPVIFRDNGPVHSRETGESDAQLYQALTTIAQVAARVAEPAPNPTPSPEPVPDPVNEPDPGALPVPGIPSDPTTGLAPAVPGDSPGISNPAGAPPPPPSASAEPPPPVSTPPPAPPPSAPPPSPPPPPASAPPPSPPPPPTGRYKLTAGSCVWDPGDSGPDQCSPLPPPGRFKFDGRGSCYWEPNDFPPDQCSPPAPATGRYKVGGGGCYWDANDSGPDQCAP